MQIPPLEVRNLTMAYEDFVVMEELNFVVERGEIFAIIGGSGSGKSTLMKHLIGLMRPSHGEVLFEGEDIWREDENVQRKMRRRMGVMYQKGALWSGMTLAENVGLPLEEYTDLKPGEISDIVSLKLSLVGLKGFESFYPSEISGGMNKRAALARAMALDPDILFFDEPTSGLDPITAGRFDDLVLRLREGLGTTIVFVSHDLSSIFKVADRALFLDSSQKTMTALGNPMDMKENPPDEEVSDFLSRNIETTH